MPLGWRFLLLFCITPSSSAFFWSRPTVQGNLEPQIERYGDLNELLTQEELNSLFLGQDSLDKYARRPDCFHRASTLIRTHCAQLDMDEDERVHAAISMTLCEIATARHHSTPLECAPFAFDPVISRYPSRSLQAECVEALSRSAQFWSSYSGYLREVPQLCFAFRRWNDIDTAREIYQNATLEKTALLRLLTVRENLLKNGLQSWHNHVYDMRDSMSHIQAAARSIGNTTRRLVKYMDKDLEDKLALFKSTMDDLQREQGMRDLHFMRQTASALEQTFQRHAQDFQGLLPRLEDTLIQHLGSIITSFQSHMEASLDVASDVQTRWVFLGEEVSRLAESVFRLSTTASEITASFNYSIEQAGILNETHRQIGLSSDKLTERLSGLALATQTEMEKIQNVSETFIQRTLSYNSNTGVSSWLFFGLTKMAEVVLKVDPSSLDHWNHLGSFRALLLLSNLLGSVFRAFFSGFLTISVFAFSSGNYISSFVERYVSLIAPPAKHIEQNCCPATVIRGEPMTDHDPRLRRQFQRGCDHRISRIPDRLCRPLSDEF